MTGKGLVVIGTAGFFLLLFLAYLVLSVLVDLDICVKESHFIPCLFEYKPRKTAKDDRDALEKGMAVFEMLYVSRLA